MVMELVEGEVDVNHMEEVSVTFLFFVPVPSTKFRITGRTDVVRVL